MDDGLGHREHDMLGYRSGSGGEESLFHGVDDEAEHIGSEA